MHWTLSHRADPRALPLADRHYNRQKVGSPQFVPPGRCLVLLSPEADALWVTSWPFAEYVKHAWAGAWVNSMFRNESAVLSSELIREAVAITRSIWEPPPLGLVTFVDPTKVRQSPKGGGRYRRQHFGWSYRKAGFKECGYTKGGLLALQLHVNDMPEPKALPRAQQSLFEAA